MGLYRDQGVVLRTYKLGEADRIVVILTRGHGKVRAVAKGVRKTKSRFGGRLEPASHVDLLLYEGRGELDIVTQAESIDHFRALRDDLDRLAPGRRRCWRWPTSCRWSGEANARLYQMLLGGPAHAGGAGRRRWWCPAFFLKAAGAGGLPARGRRVRRLRRARARWWRATLEEGGLRCASHRLRPGGERRRCDLLQDVLGGRLGAALAETRPPVVSRGRPPGGAGDGAPPRAPAALGRDHAPRLTGSGQSGFHCLAVSSQPSQRLWFGSHTM